MSLSPSSTAAKRVGGGAVATAVALCGNRRPAATSGCCCHKKERRRCDSPAQDFGSLPIRKNSSFGRIDVMFANRFDIAKNAATAPMSQMSSSEKPCSRSAAKSASPSSPRAARP
jgi:hypothetical protein